MTDQEHIGYLLAGLPGAGKSAAAEQLQELTGGTIVETGDVVRDAATKHGIENPTSEELGEFAAEMREIRGNSFATEVLVGEILRGERDIKWPLILVGVRHEDEVNEARDFLDRSQLFFIEAERDIRLERLQDRGREGEDEFVEAQLMNRDVREMDELGLRTIMDSDRIDTRIFNDGSLDDFHEKIEGAVWYRD